MNNRADSINRNSNNTNETIKSAELGAVVGCNDLSAVKSVDSANYAAVNSNSGHGIMAEEALNLIDRFTGKAAEIVGRSNEKDGADRLVDGVQLQTKFYSSGKGCVDACFADSSEGGMYRYVNPDGSPMPVEVPKDMYDEAVERFAKKITDGKVPGVNDAGEADKFVKASCLTYDDAKNLCRPMTSQSLLYDAATGIVHCSFAFGISAAVVFIITMRKSGSVKRSALAAVKTGIKVFGLAYVCHILSSQFARTEFFASMWDIASSVESEGSAANVIMEINNGLSLASGGTMYSAATCVRRFSKALRVGFVINLLTVIVFLVPDIVRVCFGRISLGEFCRRVLIIICGRICAAIAAACISVLLSSLMVLPWVFSMILCLAAACIGGIYGRTVGEKLWMKIRIKYKSKSKGITV